MTLSATKSPFATHTCDACAQRRRRADFLSAHRLWLNCPRSTRIARPLERDDRNCTKAPQSARRRRKVLRQQKNSHSVHISASTLSVTGTSGRRPLHIRRPTEECRMPYHSHHPTPLSLSLFRAVSRRGGELQLFATTNTCVR